jgi:hypothetical protein
MVKICVKNDRLPLAIYREVATHLAQVPGVTAVCLPQTASEFSYTLSQVGGLVIDLADDLADELADELAERQAEDPGSFKGDARRTVVDPRASRAQVDRILAYYGNRYGAWLQE